MAVSTLTDAGRAALAHALSMRPLHLAWGSGDPAWETMPEDALPSLVGATALVSEVGRRTVTVGFVVPDEAGDIVIPLNLTAAGEVQVVRYRRVDFPTPNLYVYAAFDYADAASAVIREAGLFADTAVSPDLPPGQRYFTPDQLTDPGKLVAVQIVRPSRHRSAAVRESVEFVLPI